MDKAIAFYSKALGWTTKTMPTGDGQPPYVLFQAGDLGVAGGTEMNSMVPAEVPSYWMVYFAVGDVDATFKKAMDAGGREMLAPQGYPGGRVAILSDPQGAVFAIRSITAR
jgi:predicted enzyme related to lactoylglutathione lyase